MSRVHFISGLPRSGSTLLAALLRQNPGFRAGIISPMAGLLASMARQMSYKNETSIFISDDQREAIMRAAFFAYHRGTPPAAVIFDTNRVWTARLPLLARLFPDCRVICMVRDVAMIIDSFERLFRENPLMPSRMFDHDPGTNLYTRTDTLLAPGGTLAFAYNALRDAAWGRNAKRLLLLRYESLAADPAYAMRVLCDFIGEPAPAFDFDNVALDEPAYDAQLGLPGLHRVSGPVLNREREPALPPDMIRRLRLLSFWNDPAAAPAGVTIV